jgi:hypothetical protein
VISGEDVRRQEGMRTVEISINRGSQGTYGSFDQFTFIPYISVVPNKRATSSRLAMANPVAQSSLDAALDQLLNDYRGGCQNRYSQLEQN